MWLCLVLYIVMCSGTYLLYYILGRAQKKVASQTREGRRLAKKIALTRQLKAEQKKWAEHRENLKKKGLE